MSEKRNLRLYISQIASRIIIKDVKQNIVSCKMFRKTKPEALHIGYRKAWKSYIKFLGVLMVKKPTDEKYKVFDCDS